MRWIKKGKKYMLGSVSIIHWHTFVEKKLNAACLSNLLNNKSPEYSAD